MCVFKNTNLHDPFQSTQLSLTIKDNMTLLFQITLLYQMTFICDLYLVSFTSVLLVLSTFSKENKDDFRT